MFKHLNSSFSYACSNRVFAKLCLNNSGTSAARKVEEVLMQRAVHEQMSWFFCFILPGFDKLEVEQRQDDQGQ